LLISHQPQIIKNLDRTLLKLLVAKSLYFITDEHDIQKFMKILMSKGVAEDMYDFCMNLSKPYKNAVAYDYQRMALRAILNDISVKPQKFDLMTEEVKDQKPSTPMLSKLQASPNAIRSGNISTNMGKLSLDAKSEFENTCPTENRVSMRNEISSKECNLEITLPLQPEDFDKEGVTFLSECFYSFSATWNLKIDILKNGVVSVYLVERNFKKTEH